MEDDGQRPIVAMGELQLGDARRREGLNHSLSDSLPIATVVVEAQQRVPVAPLIGHLQGGAFEDEGEGMDLLPPVLVVLAEAKDEVRTYGFGSVGHGYILVDAARHVNRSKAGSSRD